MYVLHFDYVVDSGLFLTILLTVALELLKIVQSTPPVAAKNDEVLEILAFPNRRARRHNVRPPPGTAAASGIKRRSSASNRDESPAFRVKREPTEERKTRLERPSQIIKIEDRDDDAPMDLVDRCSAAHPSAMPLDQNRVLTPRSGHEVSSRPATPVNITPDAALAELDHKKALLKIRLEELKVQRELLEME